MLQDMVKEIIWSKSPQDCRVQVEVGMETPQEVVIGPRQDMALEETEDTRTEKVTPEDLDQVEDQAEE